MVKRTKRRLYAFSLAAILGVTSVIGWNHLEKTTFAENSKAAADKVVFAEGDGTGKDFSEASWQFAGVEKNSGKDVTGTGREPGIVEDNQYLKDGKKVIRLINGVKAKDDKSGLEAGDSYKEYRSGEAFLSKGIALDTVAKFSVKYTFSMPEACVNNGQTGGDAFAREVGGDGIAFVMTKQPNHIVQAGSGIGYQGIQDSVAVELDSYFNGAYCDMSEGSYAYKNWGFDNQLYFHTDPSKDGVNDFGDANPWTRGWQNYVNQNYSERFDHVAINIDGDVKNHHAISYINGKDPTELSGSRYVNLAYRYGNTNTGTNIESTNADCATRFTDKGVNDRLFTVWIDYDGGTMNVSYANGNFTNAVKPAQPQISEKVNLEKFNGKTVYMGFTSAIGSSKANHTIHSFQFSNVNYASYKLNYYLKNEATGEYELKESSPVKEGEVGTGITALEVDENYPTAYEDQNYILSTTHPQETSVKLEEAGKTYEMNVYYDPKPGVSYQLNYYLKNKETGEYELNKSSAVMTGKLGAEVTAEDADKAYKNAYDAQNYALSTTHPQETSVKLEEAGKTYEMNVYYDPVEVSYQLNYYLKNKVTGEYELKKTSETFAGSVGNEAVATDVDKNYKTAYEKENYVLSTSHKQETSVKLQEQGKVYEMNVYYDPAEAYYKLNYYKYDSDKKEYVLTETTDTKTGYVGDDHKITDIDPNYGTKYKNYTVNTKKQDDFDVTLKEPGKTYEMNVYYDPEEAGYKLNYYKLNPNTEKYEYIESTKVIEGTVGQEYKVVDADADYELRYLSDGYKINKEKNEKYSVTIESPNKTYEMDVYYDPEKTTYKTEYYLQQPDGSYGLKETVKGPDTYAGKTVAAEQKAYPGYTHVAIPQSVETEVVKADGSTTMKVYYNYETEPVYKVEYYVQQDDGSYTLYKEVKDVKGKTGQKVEADIITIDGYTHTKTSQSNESDTVMADSTTVLKVYYNKVPTEPTVQPTILPTETPKEEPTEEPTLEPTIKPTVKPTKKPEKADVDPAPKPGAPAEDDPEEEETSTPDTGDHSNANSFIVLMLSSLTVLAGGVITRKREKK